MYYTEDMSISVVLQRKKNILSFCEMKEGESFSFRSEIQNRRMLNNITAVLVYIHVFADLCKIF